MREEEGYPWQTVLKSLHALSKRLGSQSQEVSEPGSSERAVFEQLLYIDLETFRTGNFGIKFGN